MRMYIEIRNVNEGASENKLWQSDPVNSSLRWQDSYLIQFKAYRWRDFFLIRKIWLEASCLIFSLTV